MSVVSSMTGVVAIGRNEGERLRQSLLSIDREKYPVVYVDSGSTDGSVALAEGLGCAVVALDLSIPFTAARARNEGFARLLALYPAVQYVQFIDGDCELDSDWLPTAIAQMDAHPDWAVVCGRRREKFPEASIYNRLVDMEWDTPIGETAACGGDALMRVAAFQQVDGYDAGFAAGEEPEMCYRMRQAGWQIWRLDAEMTRHDAALTSWRQWWTRNKRSGSAFAQGAWTHGRSSEKYDVKDSARIWFWAGVVPLGALVLLPFTAGLSLVGLLLAYVFLLYRMTRYRLCEGDHIRDALAYSVFNIAGKFPQLQGQLKFLRKRKSVLIEYKAPAAAKPTVAYVLQFFPKMSETFVYREVKALREQGYEVVTLSNRTPDPAKLPDEARGLMDSTIYAVPVDKLGYIEAGLSWLAKRPVRTLSTLVTLLAQPNESWSNRKRTLMHFASGLYLAHRAQGQHIQHIHAHFAHNAATIALVISRLLDLPFSFTAHQIFMTDQIVLREKLKAAKFIVSISDYTTDWLVDYAPDVKGLREKFHVVHCGISPEQFRPSPNRDHTRPPIILSVARWDEKKGMPYLVEACHLLRERGVDFHCIIGGDGDDREKMERLIAQHQLHDTITLPGYIMQDKLQAYHERAAVFAQACITAHDGDVDGIPVALMEPMAKGLPVISTTVSGIPELITHGVEGLLVPEKNAAALADALQFVLENEAIAEQMGKAGREKVVAEFNVDQSAAQIVTLIQQHVAKYEGTPKK